MSNTLKLSKQLIACPSITPDDAGCQTILARRLTALGFDCQTLPFEDVTNLWARRGTEAPLFVFVGHTDVVPPGPLAQWDSDPFTPQVRGDYLYGRGAADMKSSIAAMIVACEQFVAAHPRHRGSIAFLITSDEEGASVNGTKKVIEHLTAKNERIDWCVVGEPCSDQTLGDTVRIGRRGSLNAILTVHGQQGHTAYPDLAHNAVHAILPFLQDLTAQPWDEGDPHFPATHLQISNITAGTGANNVIPGEVVVRFNIRFNPRSTSEGLKATIQALVTEHQLKAELEYLPASEPFLTAQGPLLESVKTAIHTITGLTPALSTGGGTSDGRFIAPTGAEVIELGPCNATIHQTNECVNVKNLDKLAQIYEQILQILV